MDKGIDPHEWLGQAKAELEVAKHLYEVFRPMPMEMFGNGHMGQSMQRIPMIRAMDNNKKGRGGFAMPRFICNAVGVSVLAFFGCLLYDIHIRQVA